MKWLALGVLALGAFMLGLLYAFRYWVDAIYWGPWPR